MDRARGIDGESILGTGLSYQLTPVISRLARIAFPIHVRPVQKLVPWIGALIVQDASAGEYNGSIGVSRRTGLGPCLKHIQDGYGGYKYVGILAESA